jgi:hypothetical protein
MKAILGAEVADTTHLDHLGRPRPSVAIIHSAPGYLVFDDPADDSHQITLFQGFNPQASTNCGSSTSSTARHSGSSRREMTFLSPHQETLPRREWSRENT